MNEYAAARTAMVDRQVRPSDVTSFPINEAMLAVPREAFAPAEAKPIAYVDGPLPQGGGRYALEPRVFAKMLDGARIGPDDLILDLAPGLGYSTAVIARMCAAVIAVEPDEALAAADASVALLAAGGDRDDFAAALVNDDVRDAALALSLALGTRRQALLALMLVLLPVAFGVVMVVAGWLPPEYAPIAQLLGTVAAVWHLRASAGPTV